MTAVGLVGRKIGMTRIFNEDGLQVPVTILEMQPNRIVQVKSSETDGYNAIQVTAGTKKEQRITKPEAGHFAKANVAPGSILCEFRVEDDIKNYQVGSELTVSIFEGVNFVDVSAKSKGKGFQGTVKRHNFSMQRATHGNSLSHRVPGSIGQNQTPGRVFKGKKMAGHMGDENCTTQNLQLVKVDAEKNLLLVRGAVPGANGFYVVVNRAVKKQSSKKV